MGSNVFLVRDKNIYFYPYEEKCIQYIEMNFITILTKLLCKYLNISLPKFMINKSIVNANKIIFTDNAFNLQLYKSILKTKSKENLILYYMNTIDDKNKYLMNYFDNIYTFDSDDAMKYNIEFKHTPYSDKIECEKNDIYYDTLFLGRAKDRVNEIIELKDTLDKNNLNNKFMVLGLDKPDIMIKEFLNYDDYLKLLMQSKCIIEINKAGQTGCSLRFLESLFFEKKIITNNHKIINNNFYSKDNVYIIGKDKRNMREFILSPYKKLDLNLNELNFSNWIGTF